MKREEVKTNFSWDDREDSKTFIPCDFCHAYDVFPLCDDGATTSACNHCDYNIILYCLKPIIADYYRIVEKAEAEREYRRIEYCQTHKPGPGEHFDDAGPVGIPGSGITLDHIMYIYKLAQAYDNRIVNKK